MNRQFSCWIRDLLHLGFREWEMFPDGVDTSVMQAQLLGLSWNAWQYPAYSLPPTLPTQVIGVFMRRCLLTVTRRRLRLLRQRCGRSNFHGFWRHFYFFHHFDVTFLSHPMKHGGYTLTTQIMVHVRSSGSLSCWWVLFR